MAKTTDERLDEIEEAITAIKDNHLHHLCKDMEVLAVRVEGVDARVGSLEAMMRENFSRIILGLLVIAGAAVGVDLAGAMA